MSTTNQAVKPNRFKVAAPISAALKLAIQNKEIVALLDGKTLYEVGSSLGLDESDISIEYTINPKKNEEIANLGVRINGQVHLVPFSKKFDKTKIVDSSWFMTCEFRTGFNVKKNADGTPMEADEQGNLVFDEMRPFINFGNPSGLRSIRKEGAFAELTAEELAALEQG